MPRHHMTSDGPVPFTAEEEAQWDMQEAAWASEANERAAEAVRKTRDEKLSASDWTQVTDAPVDKAAWLAYRQALRDVPQQHGFPYDIKWPQQPIA